MALVTPTHVHHAPAEAWFAAQQAPFATCPITQGTLVRLLMQLGPLPAEAAVEVLGRLVAHPRHCFWPDEIGYTGVSWRGVLGHRQVTDAYLAELARHFGGKLATFDRGLAVLHADVALGLEA